MGRPRSSAGRAAAPGGPAGPGGCWVPLTAACPPPAPPAGPFVQRTAWARAAGRGQLPPRQPLPPAAPSFSRHPEAALAPALRRPGLIWGPTRCHRPDPRSPTGMWVRSGRGGTSPVSPTRCWLPHPLTRGLRSQPAPSSWQGLSQARSSAPATPLPTAHPGALRAGLWVSPRPQRALGLRRSQEARPGAYQFRVEGPAGHGVGGLGIEALPQDHHHGRASGAGRAQGGRRPSSAGRTGTGLLGTSQGAGSAAAPRRPLPRGWGPSLGRQEAGGGFRAGRPGPERAAHSPPCRTRLPLKDRRAGRASKARAPFSVPPHRPTLRVPNATTPKGTTLTFSSAT